MLVLVAIIHKSILCPQKHRCNAKARALTEGISDFSHSSGGHAPTRTRPYAPPEKEKLMPSLSAAGRMSSEIREFWRIQNKFYVLEIGHKRTTRIIRLSQVKRILPPSSLFSPGLSGNPEKHPTACLCGVPVFALLKGLLVLV